MLHPYAVLRSQFPRVARAPLRSTISHFPRRFSAQEQIVIKNSQRTYPIDIDLTRRHIQKILEILRIPQFGVYLLICSDAKMRDINRNLRQKSKSTDILSYSLPEGVYDPLSGMKEGHSYLGTMVICPAFVNRQMMADRDAYENDALDLSEDAGVSRAMASVFSVQRRLPYLLTHGMIHLTGHDHENDQDWLLMTRREDEVLHALAQTFPDCVQPPASY